MFDHRLSRKSYGHVLARGLGVHEQFDATRKELLGKLAKVWTHDDASSVTVRHDVSTRRSQSEQLRQTVEVLRERYAPELRALAHRMSTPHVDHGGLTLKAALAALNLEIVRLLQQVSTDLPGAHDLGAPQVQRVIAKAVTSGITKQAPLCSPKPDHAATDRTRPSAFIRPRPVPPLPHTRDSSRARVNDSSAMLGEERHLSRQALKRYEIANRLMELSVGDAALRFVHEGGEIDNPAPGPVLKFARELSQRYLDLMRAYVDWEISQGIPMISVDAGQLKQHGFTTQQLLAMQSACKQWAAAPGGMITSLYKRAAELGISDTHRDGVVEEWCKKLTSQCARDELRRSSSSNTQPPTDGLDVDTRKLLVEMAGYYERLPNFQLVDRTYFLLGDFAHLTNQQIHRHLDSVAAMKTYPGAHWENRLIMELRHRVTGDGTQPQTGFGNLGSNPLAYLNVLRGHPGRQPSREDQSPEAEFRGRMYFTYMCNHLANHVMSDVQLDGTIVPSPTRLEFINQRLQELSSSDDGRPRFSIAPEFVQHLHSRGPSYMPKLFVYGSEAAKNANGKLRHLASAERYREFYADNPSPPAEEVLCGLCDDSSYQRLRNPSAREILAATGELVRPRSADDAGVQGSARKAPGRFAYASGAPLFDLADSSSDQQASEYLTEVRDTGQLVLSGISGTLDQSTRMAHLVGLGVDDIEALHTIKLSYLAFMVPNLDHSVHEIMTSSRSFGLPYASGPGYEADIYPPQAEAFLEALRLEQAERGERMPEYYLSEAHMSELARRHGVLSFDSRIKFLQGESHRYLAVPCPLGIATEAVGSVTRTLDDGGIPLDDFHFKTRNNHVTLTTPSAGADRAVEQGATAPIPGNIVTWKWNRVGINPETGAILLLTTDQSSQDSFRALAEDTAKRCDSKADTWALHVTLGWVDEPTLQRLRQGLKAGSLDRNTWSTQQVGDATYLTLQIPEIQQRVTSRPPRRSKL